MLTKQNRAPLENCRLRRVLGKHRLIRVYDNWGRRQFWATIMGLFNPI